MVTLIVTNEDRPLNVSLVNQLLTNNHVTVTLQWLREAGAVYHINVMPATSLVLLTSDVMSIMIFMTVSYNIQYNVSIVSNFCGITSTKLLNYVTCDYPPQQHPVILVSGSQDSHPLIEGQFITYTCPSGFVVTGPNASVCTGNGEWEPDPGEVDCMADCGVPLIDRSVILKYNSTLDGSVLTLTCENNTSRSIDEQILHVTCHSNGSWIPDPTQFTCASLPEMLSSSPPVTEAESGAAANMIAVFSSIIAIVCGVTIWLN